MNLLLVDDDKVHLIVAGRLLRALDPMADVRIAHSVIEALQRINEARPDVVVLDLVLGAGGCGVEVAQLCRDAHIPVVFMTSSHDASNLEMMLEFGFVLPKPVSNGKLKRVLDYFKQFRSH